MGGPLIAVTKVIADRVEGLKALGELIGDIPAVAASAVAPAAEGKARSSL